MPLQRTFLAPMAAFMWLLAHAAPVLVLCQGQTDVHLGHKQRATVVLRTSLRALKQELHRRVRFNRGWQCVAQLLNSLWIVRSYGVRL
jgi:hypothetical protein